MTQQAKSVLLPIFLTCLGYACFNVNDAGLKLLLGRLHFSQLMIVSGVLSIMFMSLYGVIREGSRKTFSTSKPRLMLLRAVISQVTGLCNLLAFPHVQLTTFYTLVFTAPFWVTLLSAWHYKEKLDRRRLGVVLFGFVVVLCIFRPGTALFNVWSLIVLVSSFIYAVQLLVIRKIGSGESRAFMYMCGAVLSIIIGLFFLGDHYVPMTAYEWGLMVGMGAVAAVGLLCISYAFQEAPSASVVAPYHYTQLIWGAVLGYFMFDDVPATETMVGAFLIVLAGLYLIRHERRQSALLKVEAGA
jgi:drug/metabolite transporter (DMT)-like permease